MKLAHVITDTVCSAHSTRSFLAEKGFDITLEAGLVYIRHARTKNKVFVYPASKTTEMSFLEVEESAPKKK